MMPFDILPVLQALLVATCCWCGAWRARAIVRGRYHPMNVVTVVHCWFSGAPVLMDWIWGSPNYQIYTHLRAVDGSRATWVVFYSFSIVACLLFAGCARHFDREWDGDRGRFRSAQLFHSKRRDRLLLWMGLASPVFCALFSPVGRLWTQYATLLDLQPNPEYAAFVNVLYGSTYIALLCACGLTLAIETTGVQALPIALLTFAAVWFNGKRNIVLLGVVLILLSLRMRGVVPRRAAYVLFLVSLGAFFGYSQWYQSEYRTFLSSFDTYYETARMDFTRDSDVRMALFAELDDAATPILEYRGESLLFDALFFIPRSAWEEKPRPYYDYITATALDAPRVYRSWGITTTILSEAIANLGLVGLAVGPLFLIVLALVGSSVENPFLNVFTCVICTLFMSIHLAGFFVLWSAWCVFAVSSLGSRVKRRAVGWAMAH